MTLIPLFKSVLLIALAALSGQALAYSPEELAKSCKSHALPILIYLNIKLPIILKSLLKQSFSLKSLLG